MFLFRIRFNAPLLESARSHRPCQRWVAAKTYEAAIEITRKAIADLSDKADEERRGLPAEKLIYMTNCLTKADLAKWGGSVFELVGCTNMGPISLGA